MELNIEQIIKALDVCANPNVTCSACPLDECKQGELEHLAIALIKELTEENERLRAIPEQLHKEMSERMVEEVKTAKKYTVLIMQSEIKERCVKGGIYPAFVASTIDLIAKKMLEGEK